MTSFWLSGELRLSAPASCSVDGLMRESVSSLDQWTWVITADALPGSMKNDQRSLMCVRKRVRFRESADMGNCFRCVVCVCVHLFSGLFADTDRLGWHWWEQLLTALVWPLPLHQGLVSLVFELPVSCLGSLYHYDTSDYERDVQSKHFIWFISHSHLSSIFYLYTSFLNN